MPSKIESAVTSSNDRVLQSGAASVRCKLVGGSLPHKEALFRRCLPSKREFAVTSSDDRVQTATTVQGDKGCGGDGIVGEVSGDGSESALTGDGIELHISL